MMKLIRFELAKIWRKKQLLALLLVILSVNILLHWYGNRGMAEQPDLSAYKKAAEKGRRFGINSCDRADCNLARKKGKFP